MFHEVGMLCPSGVLFRTGEPPHCGQSAVEFLPASAACASDTCNNTSHSATNRLVTQTLFMFQSNNSWTGLTGSTGYAESGSKYQLVIRSILSILSVCTHVFQLGTTFKLSRYISASGELP